MAFGLFKRNQKADIILHNGTIYTLSPDNPQVSAVACREGEIIATGDFESMENLIGGDTEIVDLDGQFALPGFFDLYSQPALKAFEGRYIDLKGCGDIDNLYKRVDEWCSENPDADIIFGYGYNESILGSFEDKDQAEKASCEIKTALDKISGSRPVVLLCESTVSCLLSQAASAIVEETAEEEVVEYITVPYILNLLLPFDFEAIQGIVCKDISLKSRKGFTSILSLNAPSYFDELYRDALISLYNEDLLNQRFFSSYLMNRPLITEGLIHKLLARRTTCLEVNHIIHSDILNLQLNSPSCPVEFSQNALNTILESVADRGFDIFIKAFTAEDAKKAYIAADYVMGKGGKTTFAVQAPDGTDGFLDELVYSQRIDRLLPPEEVFQLPTEQFIEYMTLGAAALTSTSRQLGSVEKGKVCDIAVYDRDPMTMSPVRLMDYPAAAIVFNGRFTKF